MFARKVSLTDLRRDRREGTLASAILTNANIVPQARHAGALIKKCASSRKSFRRTNSLDYGDPRISEEKGMHKATCKFCLALSHAILAEVPSQSNAVRFVASLCWPHVTNSITLQVIYFSAPEFTPEEFYPARA